MQIHLYISRHASSGSRLKAALRGHLERFQVIEYNNLQSVGRVLPFDYAKPDVGVLMLGSKEELNQLALNSFTRNLKSILILPLMDKVTMTRAYELGPVIIYHDNYDFSEVTIILDHIHKRSENQTG